jgi:Fe-S cluster biogenesis protein NfuA
MADEAPPAGGDMKQQVADVIATIRPFIQGDGGDIELIDVDAQGVVSVRLHGACIGCPSATMTLSLGVERHLKDKVPGVSQVVCV